MAEEKDLLLAIAKEQHSDLNSILVYTDWLQDNDHALRAEYIRNHVALFLGRPSREAKWLFDRIVSLRYYVQKRYLFDVVTAAREGASYGFADDKFGFVSMFYCSVRDWPVLADQLMAVQPVFRVCLEGRREEIDKDIIRRQDWNHLYFNFG